MISDNLQKFILKLKTVKCNSSNHNYHNNSNSNHQGNNKLLNNKRKRSRSKKHNNNKLIRKHYKSLLKNKIIQLFNHNKFNKNNSYRNKLFLLHNLNHKIYNNKLKLNNKKQVK